MLFFQRSIKITAISREYGCVVFMGQKLLTNYAISILNYIYYIQYDTYIVQKQGGIISSKNPHILKF